MRTRIALATLLLFAARGLAPAATPNAYDTAHAAMQQQLDGAKTKFKDNPNVLVTDGVIADRAAKTVKIIACATGLSPSDPVEFFVAPFDSGKDYEALAVTDAKPSDVCHALEFIGLKPGGPVDFDKNRQWPRGPRVVMTFDAGPTHVRAEDLIVDSDHKAPLPQSGLVFTGSYTYTDAQGKSHFAADTVDEKPIAPDYNDPAAVLDVPRRAAQSAVYGFQRPAANHTFNKGDLLTITLTPATGDAAVVERNVTLKTKLIDGTTVYTLASDHQPTYAATDLPHLVNIIAKNIGDHTDWFTTVTVDPAMQVTDARKLYAVLMALEKDPGIKLDPPVGNDLFYRAFFPDEQWRNRENRLGEPWELFLSRDDGKLTGRLERVVDNDDPASTQPNKLESYAVPTALDFTKTVNAHQSQWSKVIFIYPPADLTYGNLMKWAGPVMNTYPRVFVFTPKP